ncbi:MAG TPA: FadD3 family acyl-CoA ligase [Actinophytocola sp.]|uniref:FadD3 family acyl-CoA ligase n=1 Tax=Actinophytocola sp. TaxID=1872138 RepID=UPI002DB611DC|nr:FadD3 family acyl-CoA ligase [Actinophytocola sp.]HEU5473469.1 FadD3 family acyl-CoA ligase [Actinophytocola sp.]
MTPDAATIPAALVRAAGTFGDREAVVDPHAEIRLSYAELLDRARTVARALIAGGLRPGDRVALCSPNTHHWIEAALGALYAGTILVPVNTRFTGPELLDVVRRSRARALFVAGPFLGVDRLEQLWKAGPAEELELIIRVPVEGEGDWAELAEQAAAVPADEADRRAATTGPDQVADILFTSGTTGRSKGAMSAHRQSLGVAGAWTGCAGLTADDRYLVINPFFHSFGYKAGILAALLRGATLVPQLVFDAGRTMELIERERITVLPGPPTIYQTMLDRPDRTDHDLSTLRLAVTGAATVPVTLVERMRAELGFDVVLTAYGLTEAVVATMCRPDDDPHTVAHTSGRAIAGMEVRACAGTGEILLRGPNVMLGYLDDPEATRQAVDPEGWLHTGDVGRLDERGYLTITDRLKDMYVCGGFNVYPAEVEQVLARLPGLAESAVVGVPDERLGEVGKAFVIPAPGRTLRPEDVIAFCRERLANYKVPRQVEVRAELPRNPAGKILKRLLRSIP